MKRSIKLEQLGKQFSQLEGKKVAKTNAHGGAIILSQAISINGLPITGVHWNTDEGASFNSHFAEHVTAIQIASAYQLSGGERNFEGANKGGFLLKIEEDLAGKNAPVLYCEPLVK